MPLAKPLAIALHLPLVAPKSMDVAFLLTRTPDRWELRETGPKADGPVYVFFDPEALKDRHRPGQGRKRDLAVAMGMRRCKTVLNILDATAGLGRDAFALALLGCKVTMMERSPIIAALLEDGLERARQHPLLAPIVQENLFYSQGDSLHWLNSGLDDAARPDVIYLDPMHPPRTKSALVRKGMRRLRAIVGEDADAQDLFLAARRCARQRVVVKRPRRAEPLAQQRPSYEIVGRTVRYEVYLTDSLKT
ncbi:MAG: class I SAM-dependent methyltransferase [Magnetococcales bacterium]|nr:class I SAM-dependent methyltransferase [Magnetococcales bacterium]